MNELVALMIECKLTLVLSEPKSNTKNQLVEIVVFVKQVLVFPLQFFRMELLPRYQVT